MGWTDERVETLKRLWLDGQSASQIAKQLGGVTRNAVIGKVHRLGLSGRAPPSEPSKPVFKAPRPARPANGTLPGARRAAADLEEEAVADIEAGEVEAEVEVAEVPAIVAASVAVQEAEPPETRAMDIPVAEPEPEAPARALAVIPERGVATVLTLGAHMCKWPIGDPSTDDFSFCGRRAPPEGPYCVEHARVAYQPQQTRKKAVTGELARSLRRYV